MAGAAQWQLRSRVDWRCPVAAKVPPSQCVVALPIGSYTLPGTHCPVTASTPCNGAPLVCCFRDAMYPEAYMSLELHDAHEFAWLTAPIRYPAAQDLHPR